MRLRGFSLPVYTISASSLSKAISCPELWRRRYLLKEDEKVFTGMFMGSVDHKTHEENFTQKVETGEDLELAWMLGRYKANWEDSLVERDPDWQGDNPSEMQLRGMRMVEAYHTLISPSVQPVKVEERFEEAIVGVPVPLVGYMDIEREDRILERKTANKKISVPKPEWRFQARVYQLVADKPTEWHVVTSQDEPRIYTPENAPDLFLDKGNPDAIVRVIQQTVQRLDDLYQRYGPDEYWPTEGLFHPWLCSRCSFRDWGCPAWTVP